MKQSIQESFEEVLKTHERRIYYHIHKLNIHDPHQEFYQEGVCALWESMKTYQPGKSQFSTHLHNTIKRRLVDLLRKQECQKRYESIYYKDEMQKQKSGNRYRNMNIPIHVDPGITLDEVELWAKIESLLTVNQGKWVKYYIFMDMSNREIAEQENVSVEAVKSWAKQAKQKLRKMKVREGLPE